MFDLKFLQDVFIYILSHYIKFGEKSIINLKEKLCPLTINIMFSVANGWLYLNSYVTK